MVKCLGFLFLSLTYASENIVGDENMVDNVSCRPRINSSCGSFFNNSARSPIEAKRKRTNKNTDMIVNLIKIVVFDTNHQKNQDYKRLQFDY